MSQLRRIRLHLRAVARGHVSPTTLFGTVLAIALALAAGLSSRADATSPTCTSVGFAVAPLHGTRFYVDSSSSPVLDSGYTGVSLSPTAAQSNVWVQLSGFSGGELGLASTQPAAFPLGNLGAGSTTPAYFFLTASPVAQTATAQSFNVDVYRGDPSHGGTLLCSYADGYSSGVYDTIQASANKVQDVTGDNVAATLSTSSPVIGGTVTLTVEGTTGTLGNGPDGTPFIYETPTSLSSWPAGSFRLVGTTLTLSPGASQTVYTNQLQVASSSFGAAQSYIAQYTFQITGTTASATTPYPIQEISSGTQVKHTNTSSITGSIPAIPQASNPLSLSQTPSATSLPSSGGTVTYTVKLHSTSSTTSSVDDIIDTLPSNATYQSGSAKLDGSAIADPTASSGALVFPGPFTVSSAADRTLAFSVTLPATAGTYTNAVAGNLASTAVATAANVSTTVAGAPQTITFAQPASTRVDQGPVSLSASASSGLAVGFSSSTASVCTVSGSSVTLVSAGTCSISASQAGNATYAAAADVTKSFQVTAAPLTQTITFAQPADTRVDQGPVSLSAGASSGLAVSFLSSTATVCTVSGSTVSLVSVGTCSISASQAGNATYAAAASVTRSFQVTVAPLTQTITFAQPADTRVDQGPVSLSASASSGLAVSFTSTTIGVCTVSGSSVTLVTAGTCTITASQPGDATYVAALPVTRSFVVTAVPTIAFAQPADTRIDEGPLTVSATASGGLPVGFASTTTGVCTVSGSTVTLVSTGTCTIVASSAGAADVTRSFQVTAAPSVPTITFAQPADTRVDQGPVSPSASVSGGGVVAIASSTTSVCTVAGSTVSLVAVGTCTLVASSPGATDVTRSFQVTAAPSASTITFAQPADTRVDQGPVSLGASVSGGGVVAIASSTPSVCTVAGSTVTLVAVGTCTLVASSPGASDVARSFQVTALPATPQLTFPQPGDTQVDSGPVSLAASISNGAAVSFSTSTPAVCTVSGTTVTLVSTGTCTIVASATGVADVTRSFDVTLVPPAAVPPAPQPEPEPAPAAPAPQEIVFAPVPPVAVATGPIAIGGSATSGLSVGYDSATPDVCIVSGSGTVTAVASGTCTIVAHQPGDGSWAAAPDVRESFTVELPPLPAPTATPAATVAGNTTRSIVGGIPSGATVAVDGIAKPAGVAALRIVGTQVIVTATKTFSGVVRIPVVVTSGGRSVDATVPVVVRPAAPSEIAVVPQSGSRTRIAWKASPSATGYLVRVDGRVVCTTTGTSCDVAALVAPSDKVVVTSVGRQGTRSNDAPAAYAPRKPVLIAVVHFATASSTLAPAARAILDATQTKIAKGGFTHAILTCHTDDMGPLVYNMALSAARCASVAAYVKRTLGIARVTYRQAAFAYLRPAAPNTTAAGMAKNRRVEVYVK